jgi:hypothetical protein
MVFGCPAASLVGAGAAAGIWQTRGRRAGLEGDAARIDSVVSFMGMRRPPEVTEYLAPIGGWVHTLERLCALLDRVQSSIDGDRGFRPTFAPHDTKPHGKGRDGNGLRRLSNLACRPPQEVRVSPGGID